MKISQIEILLQKLKKDLINHNSIYPSDSLEIQYKNLFSLISEHLPEHKTFLYEAVHATSRKSNMISSLTYLKTILDMKIEELKTERKNILDSAWDKLEKASLSFEQGDNDGASNKLNSCIELALKDVLDIPTTIKGINTSKIIDIMISENIGPIEYLKEVKIHVIMDNFVKHQGLSPMDARIVNAISATENLLKKLPKTPFELNDQVKEKLWSGIRKEREI